MAEGRASQSMVPFESARAYVAALHMCAGTKPMLSRDLMDDEHASSTMMQAVRRRQRWRNDTAGQIWLLVAAPRPTQTFCHRVYPGTTTGTYAARPVSVPRKGRFSRFLALLSIKLSVSVASTSVMVKEGAQPLCRSPARTHIFLPSPITLARDFFNYEFAALEPAGSIASCVVEDLAAARRAIVFPV
jgi:hypothetical protein